MIATKTFAMDYVMSNYGHPHNLGGHNVLLEAVYDLWVRNRF